MFPPDLPPADGNKLSVHKPKSIRRDTKKTDDVRRRRVAIDGTLKRLNETFNNVDGVTCHTSRTVDGSKKGDMGLN